MIGFNLDMRRGAAIVALMLCCPSPARADEVTLVAPGGIRAAIEKLIPEFERRTGHKVRATFGSGGGTKQQVVRGDPFDVPIVQPPYPDVLASGHVVPASETPLATVAVAVAVRKGAPKPDISTPAAVKRMLLSATAISYPDGASGAAAGVSFDDTLRRLGIAAEMQPKIKRAQGGAGAMALLAKGEVDIGLTFLSEITDPGVDAVGVLPREISTPTMLVGFVSAQTKSPDAAKALLQYLSSPDAAPVYRANGMQPASSAPAVPRAANAPRNDLPQPYRTTRDWGQLPAGVKWAAVTAIEPAPDGSIYVIHRCFANSCKDRHEAPILKYDATGKLLKTFGEDMFVFPHGSTIDRDGNLWVTDAQGANGKGHQVFKFSPDGRVLMTLGKAGVSGSGPDLFDQPCDVVVAANGDIFVADSHRNGKNNRIVKFTKDGRFIKEWGRKGSGPGEFSEPHTIAIDSRGRLFVGDRENNRIQIFDQDGKLLDEWRQFGRPSGIAITRDDTIYVADSESGPDTGAHELPGIKKGIRIGSARTGEVTAFIEDMESTTGDHSGAEGVGVDANGNVYGGVVRRQMLERHVRK
jgi:molybdenum ABC transporter molybdate-binding protein